MKLLNSLITLLFLSVATLSYAQGIRSAEYYIDDDPGVGLGNVLEPEDGSWGEMDEVGIQTIDTSDLSVGPHCLGVRFQHTDGTWSYTQTTWFRIQGQPILVGAEYFINEDPGQGFGIPIPQPTDGQWDESDEEIDVNNIDISKLQSNGPDHPEGHTLFVRFIDSDGNWGTTRQANFQIASTPYLIAAEWTTDPTSLPGQGHEMDPADGTWDQPEEELVGHINTSDLSITTDSIFYVRVKDSLGRWSTRGGWFLDESGQWVFDPNEAWSPGSFVQVNH